VLFDLLDLDRRVNKVAAALERRRAAPSSAPLEEVAFDREVSSRATYQELGSLADDPLVRGVCAWVAHLTLERVTSPDAVAVRAARLELGAVDATASVDEHVRRLLGSERDARASAAELERVSARASDAHARLAERRAEAARLLGVADEPEPELAAKVLSATRDAFDVIGPPGSWLQSVQRAIASDASEGWPAKLSVRWLHEQLSRGDLFKGVRLDAPRPPLPLGASSFALALHRLGAAWSWADRPEHTPLCLVRAPNDALVARRAALLASLVVEPTFHTRKLGLGRDRANLQARAIGRAAVLWLRMAALGAAAHRLSRERARATFEELSEEALGRPLPRALLGVLPAPRRTGGLGLRAVLEALAERDSLRARFDEDWFDNPRAHLELRHEHHQLVTARAVIPLESGLAALDARLRELVV
jgi:hypothetical protein